MIEADKDRPGVVVLVDAKGERHTCSIYSMGTPAAAGPNTTFFTRRHGVDLFVQVPLGQARAVIKQARTLRRAQKATWKRAQMPLNFGGAK